MRNDFKGQKSKTNESWFDLEHDKELIIQSIAKQYHILPSEQENLHYSDWYELVSGLMHDTPLGQIVRIRSEDNKDIIQNFSNVEKQIRSDWLLFRSKNTNTKVESEDAARYFEKLFASMLGGEK